MANQLKLPKELQIYKEAIEFTVKDSVEIEPIVRKTSLIESKFSGDPYFPVSMEYPTNENDEPMKLLAQINFSELPKIENFPTSGLLQFFIAIDDVYGQDFDDPTSQKSFRVIYHENINETNLIEDFSFITGDVEDEFPIGKEAAMKFELTVQPISPEAMDFEKTDLDVPFDAEIDNDDYEELGELYFEYFSGDGHRIGGYPYFTQSDPRENIKKTESHSILLLQIDSDDTIECMFGDVGVANFFIKKEDLLKKDFTNVLYTWDCC